VVALEREFGPKHQAERLRPVNQLRTGAVVIFEGAKTVGGKVAALGKMVVEAVASGLSAFPQPFAGITPPVSVDEAADYFIRDGIVSLSPSDSPELPLDPREKQFVAGGEIIVYKGTIATILPLTEIKHGSPYIRD